MTLLASANPIVSDADQRIALLKDARQKIINLRELLQLCDRTLAYEFASPARKVDEALAFLLLRRELESER